MLRKTELRVRSTKVGPHIRSLFWAGPTGQTKANLGMLSARVEEYSALRYLLSDHTLISEHISIMTSLLQTFIKTQEGTYCKFCDAPIEEHTENCPVQEAQEEIHWLNLTKISLNQITVNFEEEGF